MATTPRPTEGHFMWKRYITAFIVVGALGLTGVPAPVRGATNAEAPRIYGFVPDASPQVLSNPGFEHGLHGWSQFWLRDLGTGTVSLDTQERHSGHGSARIEHEGGRDWAFWPLDLPAVKPGEVYEFSAWVKVQGNGTFWLSVNKLDNQENVLDWGLVTQRLDRSDTGWQHVSMQFLVAPRVSKVVPKFGGGGPVTIWVDDVSVRRLGQVALPQLPETLSVQNGLLDLTLNTATLTLTVRDTRTGRIWEQKPPQDDANWRIRWVLAAVTTRSGSAGHGPTLQLELVDAPTAQPITLTVQLEESAPEFTVELSGAQMTSPVTLPAPFVTGHGTDLILPVSEGVTFPVDDTSIEEARFNTFSGVNLSMAFWGVTDGDSGQMAIVETPNDFSLRMERIAGDLAAIPLWEPEKGQIGYQRRLRYAFFDHGGYVAMTNRYRDYAKAVGLFKSLAEKRKANPNLDRLIGAADVLLDPFTGDPRSRREQILREMQMLGMDRLLWNATFPEEPGLVALANAMGYVTTHYDIYQDVADPAELEKLLYIQSEWPEAAWPDEVVVDAHGTPIRSWHVRGKDGNWMFLGRLSDDVALKYAMPRIAADLATHPWLARFIDGATASEWYENYSPSHPMTRRTSRNARMDLLKYVSSDLGLITGSEDGIDAAVPWAHYFEGMMSLVPYRLKELDSGWTGVITPTPAYIAKYQVGYQYRLPLWELVYHDAIFSTWYPQDGNNNKFPDLWPKRDLFTLLYATMPLYAFDQTTWVKDRERFAASYRTISPVLRDVGYAPMTDFRYLTKGREVQQSTFGNGVTVTVNFGSAPYPLAGGTVVPPEGFCLDDGRCGKPFQPAPDPGIRVRVNGKVLAFDTLPVIDSGRLLLPLRAIGEALGAKVGWDGVTRQVTLVRNHRRVALTVGSDEASVNGEKLPLDVPPQIRDGRVFVPLRFIVQALEASVDWNAISKTAAITFGP